MAIPGMTSAVDPVCTDSLFGGAGGGNCVSSVDDGAHDGNWPYQAGCALIVRMSDHLSSASSGRTKEHYPKVRISHQSLRGPSRVFCLARGKYVMRRGELVGPTEVEPATHAIIRHEIARSRLVRDRSCGILPGPVSQALISVY